jgi:acetolactate synthase-1/2/3 large subunit
MPRMTIAEAVVESLIRHGIDAVYALPGVHNDPLFDALHRASDRIRTLHTRHEQAACYMALGAALATGRPQVFSVVPGPGILNASAALLTAYGLGAPVLALVGQIPQAAIDRGYGHLHELPDQLGLLRHMTKHAARIAGPAEAAAKVAEAIGLAMSGRRRPVALECAIDMWGRAAPVPVPEPAAPSSPEVDEAAVAEAARILERAERPLIVAGGGALDAGAELLAVAEALQAPVVTYRRARGLIPTSHRLAASLPVGHRLWAETDAVLAVGTRFHYPQAWWGTDPRLKIVRIDIDPEQIERFRRPDCAIVADATDGLRALAAALPRRERCPRGDLAQHQAWFAEALGRLEPRVGFLRAIRAVLPADGIVVEDVTQIGFVGRLAFTMDAPRLYLSAGYQDNLGWSFGTALGVKAALPDRAVIAIAGDGGFMYQASELATAVHHKLAVVVLVFDDGAFGNVRRIQAEQFGNRLIACDLTNPDFVRLAESHGIAGFRARTPDELRAALEQALALNAPALVHVPVGEMPSPWHLIALPRVRGFEDAWRRNLP